MKVKGKQVIEIRPMTRGEYDKKHYCDMIFECAERFGLTAKWDEKNALYECHDDNVISGYDIDKCKKCFERPAKVNEKYIMLVRVKNAE